MVKNTFTPSSLKEALKVLKENDCSIMSGGTDLMVRNKKWTGTIPSFQKDVIFINKIKELKEIKIDENNISIGASVTLSAIEQCYRLPETLRRAALNMASPAIRNRGTIGGNICNASPAGDSLPTLYALEAELEIMSLNNTRVVKIEDFICGPGKKNLNSDEMVTKIIIPKKQFEIQYYKKIGTRKSLALSKASFTGICSIKDNKIEDIRITFGAVAPRIVKVKKCEDLMLNKKYLEEKFIEDIVSKYEEHIIPIDDQRSNRFYRKKVSLNILRDFLESVNKSLEQRIEEA